MVNLPRVLDPAHPFASNRIWTSKYTFLTFLPKNIYEQFRRVANLFFLALAIIQFFPQFQTIDPVVAALPFIIIITLTAMKDGVEDWRRHISDNQINRQETLILDHPWVNTNAVHHKQKCKTDRRVHVEPLDSKTTGWRPVLWSDIQVGDMILLRDHDPIPADLVILSTSEPNGLCFVETKNLDGETNLKIKQSVVETSSMKTPVECRSVRFWLECEKPHTSLYSFTGTMNIPPQRALDDSTELDRIAVPLTINQLLLRGCVVRNTEWIIGVVAYTGDDTKLRLNSGETPSKRSFIDKRMNAHITVNLVLLMFMCLFIAIMDPYWELSFSMTNAPFVPPLSNSSQSVVWEGFVSFWLALLAFQNIVPVSLYLTLEVVKTMQAFLINSDIEMYYEPIDQPCFPRSWNLSDDLGQIKYIFSDKTGTLTRNIMEFKRCSINGITYGDGTEEADPFDEIWGDLGNGRISTAPKSVPPPVSDIPSSPNPGSPFVDQRLSEQLAEPQHPQHPHLISFFTSLALCHSVLVSKSRTSGQLQYKSSSPDEEALVQAARDIGFIFLGRENTTIIVRIRGEEKRYQLLQVLEFNSTRKRMSVIVRTPENEIVLHCKGADSVIYERLAPGQMFLKEETSTHLEWFAEAGLRTLCIGTSKISEDMYEKWRQEYHAASCALADRDAKMEEVADRIEQGLTLLGATAIEDKLQDGVPECIESLSRAGIRIWVLTGDKLETAINIGFSCNLLTRDMDLILIRGGSEGADSPDTTVSQMKDALVRFWGHPDDDSKKLALIIDGSALRRALDEAGRSLFFQLGTRCAAVICCRVSPLQKAKVVELVKESSKDVMCLAIGDGANDVSMIQAAHVGVGIAGEEGLQAAMASDYTIGQFKFLNRLLLVHGRWSYVKIAQMMLCFFFKNIILSMALFWFQFLCGYSSEMIVDVTYLIVYNLWLTSLPVVVIGSFDQDTTEVYALLAPQLYQSGMRHEAFTHWRFAIYMFESIYQSLVCAFIPIGAYWEGPFDNTGQLAGSGELGIAIAVCAIFNANMFCGINTNSWTWMSFAAMYGSNVAVLLWGMVMAYIPSSGIYLVTNQVYETPRFWSTFVLATIVCHLPRICAMSLHRLIVPSDIEVVQEMQSRGWTQQLLPLLERRKSVMIVPSRISSGRPSTISPASGSGGVVTFGGVNAIGGDETGYDDDEEEVEPMGLHGPYHPASADDALVETSSTDSFSRGSPAGPGRSGRSAPPRLQRKDSDADADADTDANGRAVAEALSKPETEHVPRSDSGKPGVSFNIGPRIRPQSGPTEESDRLKITFQRPSSAGSVLAEVGSHLTVMKTGEILRNRGFSFSQSPGARNVVMPSEQRQPRRKTVGTTEKPVIDIQKDVIGPKPRTTRGSLQTGGTGLPIPRPTVRKIDKKGGEGSEKKAAEGERRAAAADGDRKVGEPGGVGTGSGTGAGGGS
ncbi:uncharacterized protein BJ171DRAFT_462045 [Polychytrium aggregatum]|uniref:uncharacterized protein n=1 Tax=Polychytrium aggregatum TaxID=110093 RepID=UPI0022FE0264|nr:uncharacterized protein BJ171DRAFT_462045 [Polychytrium aggregatum]KAI9199832.1 hypothetical protein BJ171DRAFT_462045 [Polychytrium aggregatum]